MSFESFLSILLSSISWKLQTLFISNNLYFKKSQKKKRRRKKTNKMLSMGLQLEESQSVISHRSLNAEKLTLDPRRAIAMVFKNVGQHETPMQGRSRIERETKLHHKIDGWIAVQQLFIPEAALLRQREAAKQDRIGATQSLPRIRARKTSSCGCHQRLACWCNATIPCWSTSTSSARARLS
jgi:hypothetical protein